MMWGYGYGGGMTWWMVVIDVLFALLVVVAIAAVIMFFVRETGAPRSSEGNAQRVLAERFARGEIDEDEFKRSSAALSSHAGYA